MREKRRRRRLSRDLRIRAGERAMMRKRKATLALSASVISVSSVALPAMEPIVMQAVAETETRKPAALLRASDALKEAMIEEEGVKYTVYRDVAGYPTVGVGHLVTSKDRLSVGDTITKDRVLELLSSDLEHAENVVTRITGDLPLYQHEFDALVDLAFNVGEGTISQRNSPKLHAAIAARDYQAVADELDYLRAGGAPAKGLVYRSERRTNIFLDADYSNPRSA